MMQNITFMDLNILSRQTGGFPDPFPWMRDAVLYTCPEVGVCLCCALFVGFTVIGPLSELIGFCLLAQMTTAAFLHRGKVFISMEKLLSLMKIYCNSKQKAPNNPLFMIQKLTLAKGLVVELPGIACRVLEEHSRKFRGDFREGRSLGENGLEKGNESQPGEKCNKSITDKGNGKNEGDLSKHSCTIHKNSNFNRKLLDTFSQTIILEIGIKFSMKDCYHLGTLKQIMQKTLPYVEQTNYSLPEERTGLPHIWGCAHRFVLPGKEAHSSSTLQNMVRSSPDFTIYQLFKIQKSLNLFESISLFVKWGSSVVFARAE